MTLAQLGTVIRFIVEHAFGSLHSADQAIGTWTIVRFAFNRMAIRRRLTSAIAWISCCALRASGQQPAFAAPFFAGR